MEMQGAKKEGLKLSFREKQFDLSSFGVCNLLMEKRFKLKNGDSVKGVCMVND